MTFPLKFLTNTEKTQLPLHLPTSQPTNYK